MTLRPLGLLACLLFAACGGSNAASPSAAAANAAADADAADGVHTFTSIPWGFDTNSFWIEGPKGVVVIDTQFLPSEAERAATEIERATKKHIVLAVVLHPNPDKFNGADVFRAHGARVVTSAQVLAHVPAVAAQRREAFYERYAPDYPTKDPTLESFGSADTTLHDGGVDVSLHIMGRGCSEAHVVATYKGHVFTGDLVASGTHSWLELGYAREWLARLLEIDAMAPRRVHPGRGPSGGPELVANERAYLTRVLSLVDDAKPTSPAPPGAIENVRAQLEKEYPKYGYPVFLYGLAAVWRAEATRLATSSR